MNYHINERAPFLITHFSFTSLTCRVCLATITYIPPVPPVLPPAIYTSLDPFSSS